MKKAIILACLLAAGTVAGIALADTATTGTVVACATATAPTHTVAVDGANVSTVGGDSAAQCETTTYTVPTVTNTQTVTTTQTVTVTDPGTTTTTPSSPWTNIVNEDFTTKADGYWPTNWCHYSGKDNVFGQGYYTASHAYVQGGLLHLLSSYDASGPNGAAWYTGGFSIKGSTCGGTSTGPFGYSANNSEMTVRMRVVETGTAAAGHRNIIFWPDAATGGTDYAKYGEEDMIESDVGLNNASLFLHYLNGTTPAQVAWTYPSASLDLSTWHTYRFVNLNGVISIYIDDMTTPIHTYTCTSTTCPVSTKHWVLQQQMHNPNGTPPASSASEDWQVSSIVIDKAN